MSHALDDKNNSSASVLPANVVYGRSVMEQEAAAILELAKALNHNFDWAVKTILEISSAGHVIVSGVGKAGFVGMKISATLASTGVPSFFLHPAEAVHGDLGRYTRNDLALLLSNSGETDEILKIIPQIKRTGCPIIAITGKDSSPLARLSDVVLDIGDLQEAGPLGLAPTTSTTVMLALGDALAMVILKHKGLSAEQFARFHPGGNLGRLLTPVAEIMRQGDEHCIVNSNEITREVLQKMTRTKRRPGAATVINSSGVLAGIFTDGDLRRWLDRGPEFLELPVAEVMGTQPKTVCFDQLCSDALKVLSEHKVDQLIVVDRRMRPVGMIDVQDLVTF